ncbi:MAG: SpoIIE family protein phosphatase [Treponema sp.]|jgi:sigma-B regulation protein RsbU (phosphoserine phosphatase)|nr:SpoIIE family protein phosphatase [Treponema sp.]
MTARHSLRTKILLIVLVFTVFTGAAFGVYSWVMSRHYKSLRLEGIRKTVEIEIEKVNKEIAEIERSAIYFAVTGLLFYKSQSNEIGETSILEYLRSFTNVVGGGFWFEPFAYNKETFRRGIYAFFDRAIGALRLEEIGNEYDYLSMIWYREIADVVERPHQVVWTRPYVDDSSFSLMTTAGAGIFDENGKLIAVSIIDWEIEKVVERLTEVKPTQNSFVMLCAPEQDYVISSTRTKSVVGESVKNLPYDINSVSFELYGIKYMRFGWYMDNGWLLSVQIPEKEVFAYLRNQTSRFSVITALSLIVMLCLAYYLISKQINSPLKRLTDGVSRLALGNMDVSIAVKTNDELELLAQTFNKMTSDLKKSIEEAAREHDEKERIKAELNIATAIQTSMLPCIFPPFPERQEFDLYASMVPAKEVGGDFYDFYFVDKDNLAVVIADVSGKGVPAALFMVITKTLIKNCSSCKNPRGVFETVNNKLCESNETGMFVTAFMGLYNIPTGRFMFVNAGHNPPLLKKRNGGFQFLRAKPCLVLAWMKGVKYIQEEIFLERGDVLYLYTDGVTEAMNKDNVLFSEARLLEAANRNLDCTPEGLISAIKREVNVFSDGCEQADDITMLALKIRNKNDSTGDEIKRLEVTAEIENLDKVLNFINNELEKLRCPAKVQGDINVAVEEIFMNIANYAYAPDKGAAAISVSVNEKAVIRFEDTGRPYNPLLQPGPELHKPVAEREPGGLGVFLVKKLMDKVEYTREEGRNVLVISKRLQESSA